MVRPHPSYLSKNLRRTDILLCNGKSMIYGDDNQARSDGARADVTSPGKNTSSAKIALLSAKFAILSAKLDFVGISYDFSLNNVACRHNLQLL